MYHCMFGIVFFSVISKLSALVLSSDALRSSSVCIVFWNKTVGLDLYLKNMPGISRNFHPGVSWYLWFLLASIGLEIKQRRDARSKTTHVLSCGVVYFSSNTNKFKTVTLSSLARGPFKAWGPIWRNRSNRLKTGPDQHYCKLQAKQEAGHEWTQRDCWRKRESQKRPD